MEQILWWQGIYASMSSTEIYLILCPIYAFPTTEKWSMSDDRSWIDVHYCHFSALQFLPSLLHLFSCYPLSILGTLRYSNFHHSPLQITQVFSLTSMVWTIRVPFTVLQILFYSFSFVYKLLIILCRYFQMF